MNWYFLVPHKHLPVANAMADVRDHLLEVLQGLLDICASSDIVFDLVDKRRIWYASRIRRCQVSPVTQFSYVRQRFEKISS